MRSPVRPKNPEDVLALSTRASPSSPGRGWPGRAGGRATAGWDWQWTVLYDLWLVVLVRLGDKNETARALPEARRLAAELDGDGRAFSSRLRWLEGRMNRSADALREAREVFMAAGDDVWSARTTLDLLLGGYSEKEDGLKLASQLAATLGAMARSSEGVAVAKVMQEEVASGGVTMRVLEAAGRVLQRLEDDLRAREALRFVGE